jgi:hypothetical protein
MENQDRQAIEGLFSRLGEVERQAGPRDAEAEGFIRDRISNQPGAPYFMAQTIVMQDYALQQAQARIQQLEQERQEQEERPASGGGFLSGMFGSQSAPRRSSVPASGRTPLARDMPMGGPTGAPMGTAQMAPGAMGQMQPGRGGGFLAGAAQTAMGVAGGVLLGNALAGMFGGDEAKAAEPAAAEPAPAQQPQEPPAAEEEAGGGFFDGWFGGDEEG